MLKSGEGQVEWGQPIYRLNCRVTAAGFWSMLNGPTPDTSCPELKRTSHLDALLISTISPLFVKTRQLHHVRELHSKAGLCFLELSF